MADSAARATANNDSHEAYDTVIIDKRGDLSLIVGEELVKESDSDIKPTKFQVCSATLARCSPVFKAMLFSGYAESKPTAGDQVEWKVKLPADDPIVMNRLLHITHNSFPSPVSEGDGENVSELKKDEEELQTLERNLMSVMHPIARGVFTDTTSTTQKGAKDRTTALVCASSVDMIFVIHEILVAADKYHCVSALRPLATGWARLCKHISKEGFVCFQDDHATCVAIFA